MYYYSFMLVRSMETLSYYSAENAVFSKSRI